MQPFVFSIDSMLDTIVEYADYQAALADEAGHPPDRRLQHIRSYLLGLRCGGRPREADTTAMLKLIPGIRLEFADLGRKGDVYREAALRYSGGDEEFADRKKSGLRKIFRSRK
jgi:hypothetical protein